jgi:hypothetical protein
MSTISDAIKKRKKEAGEKEVEGLIPVVLDEPDVDVPRERSFKRAAFIGTGILLVAAAAVSAVILFRGMPGRKSPSRKGEAPPRTASLRLPESEEGMAAPGDETNEALPLPEMVTRPPSGPGKTDVAPPEPPPGPPPGEGAVAQTRPTAVPGRERPMPFRQEAPTAAKGAPPPAKRVEPGGSPISPEKSAAPPPTDPFAAIKLQGIIRFDPAHPEVLINGKALKVGDSLNGIEVVEIGDDSVKLRHGDIERTIRY